ncbi:MAG: PHP domain-containing protein [Actinomycetota bacterium]|nr:PHP domain-containing protein [Actinomycetota bacterium]
MEAPSFDLQSHSRHSDGALSPAEVVEAAAHAGVELLALSDHDNVDGVPEARGAALDAGIRLVPAVEISAIDRGQSDLHILGYLIDDRDPTLLGRLESYRAQREGRAQAMVDALRELGFEIDESGLDARTAQGKSIGRPHLAGAVVSHPANAERLAEEQREEASTFLEAYLIDGRPAFRPREGPTVEESIEAIHEAGGVAVWAHPFWDIPEADAVLETIDRFRSFGIDGVECFYPTHGPEEAALLAERCTELALLSTGSSDFHGPAHRLFSSFRAFKTYGHGPRLGPIAG